MNKEQVTSLRELAMDKRGVRERKKRNFCSEDFSKCSHKEIYNKLLAKELKIAEQSAAETGVWRKTNAFQVILTKEGEYIS
eukprot:UN28241